MRQSRRPVASSLILSPMSSVFFDGASSAILFPADIPLDKAAPPALRFSPHLFCTYVLTPAHYLLMRTERNRQEQKGARQ